MIEVLKCSKCLVLPVITRPKSELGRYYAQIQCPVCKKKCTGLARGELVTQKDADRTAIEEWNAHEFEH